MRGAILLPLMLAAGVLAACVERAPLSGTVTAYSDWTYGEATFNNMSAQRGLRDAVTGLNTRFAREVDSMVTFAFDSAVLDPVAQSVLRRQAQWIRQFPEVRFRVYGHTDLVGSDAYNRALGLRRAQAVVAFLGAQGVDLSRLEALVSFGETRPLILTADPARRNRRTVTEVAGFVAGAPMLLNGKYAEVVFREYVASAVPQSEPAAAAAVSTTALGGGG